MGQVKQQFPKAMGAPLVSKTGMLMVCLLSMAATSGYAVLDLPTRGEILSTANITELPEVKLKDVANFEDCLNFKAKIDLKDMFCKVPPQPAAKVVFEYMEPTAIVEMTCLRGKTGFKNMQNVVSQALSSSLSQDSNQKCVEPIKSKWGTYHKYYFDTHIWGISDVARFQTNATPLEAALSLACKAGGQLNKILSTASLLTNGKLIDFSNLGQSVSELGTNAVAQVKEFTTNLANLPQQTISSIKDSFSDMSEMVTNLPDKMTSAVNDVTASIQGAAKDLGNLSTNIANFDPADALSKANDYASNLVTNIQSGFGDIGTSLAGVSSQITKVASLPGVTGVTGLTTLANAVSSVSSPLAALESFTGTTTLAQVEPVVSGVGPMNLLNTADQMDNVANALEPVAVALDSMPSDVQVASLEDVTSTRKSVAELIAALRGAAAALNKVAYDEDYKALQIAISEVSGKLGINTGSEETVKLAMVDGKLAADGFLKNGGSELAATQGDELFDGLVDTIATAGEQALALAGDIAAGKVKNVCSNLETLEDTATKLAGFKAETSQEDFDLGLFPEATYLPNGHIQYVRKGHPSPSCPLTSAGYTPHATLEGVKRTYNKCHEECDADGGNCEIVPDEGAYLPSGQTCDTNRMSTLVIDDKYPACNGMYPEVKQMYRGERYVNVQTGRYLYSAGKDHAGALRRTRTNYLRQVVNQSYSATRRAIAYAKSHSGGVDCSTNDTSLLEQDSVEKNTVSLSPKNTLMKPDFKEKALSQLGVSGRWEAMSQVRQALAEIQQSHAMTAQATPTQRVDSGFSLFGNSNDSAAANSRVEGGFSQFNPAGSNASIGSQLTNNSLTKAAEVVLNKGGPQAFVAAQVGQKMPYGLWLAFASEPTDWMQPRFSLQSALTTLVGQFANSTPLWAVCSGAASLNSMLPGEIANLRSLESYLGCIGSWGMSVEHGWAYNKVKPVAGALIGARGYRVSTRIGGIQDDVSGKPRQFNHDYPQLYAHKGGYTKASGYAASGGGRHLGSKCYDEGTTDTSWYTAGEKGASFEALETFDPMNYAPPITQAITANPSLDAEMDKGYYVQTRWKRTKCEMKVGVLNTAAIFTALATGKLSPLCDFEQKY